METLKVKGSLVLTHKKADGTVETMRKDNLILNVGYDFIANAIASPTRPNAMSYIAVGTSNTAASASQTALGGEITRIEATYEHAAGTKNFTITATFPAGVGTGAISEAGVCNAASGGVFLDRVTFSVINKGADDEVTTYFIFEMS